MQYRFQISRVMYITIYRRKLRRSCQGGKGLTVAIAVLTAVEKAEVLAVTLPAPLRVEDAEALAKAVEIFVSRAAACSAENGDGLDTT